LTFEQSIPRLVTGQIDLTSMPSIALKALEQGLDSPSLRILAGLREDEDEFTLRRYLADTLRELSIELPTKRQAAIRVALMIADEIFNDQLSYVQGVDALFRAIDSYPFHEESRHRRYDSIGLEKAYILFINAECEWDWGMSNEALEQELLMELKRWSVRMRNG